MSHTYKADKTNTSYDAKLAYKKAKQQRKLAHQRRKSRKNTSYE